MKMVSNSPLLIRFFLSTGQGAFRQLAAAAVLRVLSWYSQDNSETNQMIDININIIVSAH